MKYRVICKTSGLIVYPDCSSFIATFLSELQKHKSSISVHLKLTVLL